MAVMQAIMQPGDTFMGLDLSHGGHLSHGSPVNASGMLYKPVAYHVSKETGMVDYDEMEKIALNASRNSSWLVHQPTHATGILNACALSPTRLALSSWPTSPTLLVSSPAVC